MSVLCGEINSLRASEKLRLEKLAALKTFPTEIISNELLKRTAKEADELGVQIALILARDGSVVHVVVGTKARVYLPDLGRFRLDESRLRRLRLVVFLPAGEKYLSKLPQGDLLGSVPRNEETRQVLAPSIAGDFITDLEKLRFDLLLVVAVLNGAPGPVSLAYITPQTLTPSHKGGTLPQQKRVVSTFRAKDAHLIDINFQEFVTELESRFVASRREGYSTAKDHAILVGVYTASERDARYSMEELHELCRAANLHVVDSVMQRRKAIDPKTVVGKGKLEEIVLHSLDLGADILVFDRELLPGQLRSITNLTELRVIDRSMLILDIFAQRARSSDGKLQVELAQLKYSLPRLTERDTGLSRLSGGIGGRGPGETKLEIGRRRTRDRIADLEKRIKKLALQRGVRRERRQERGVPVVAIVGYTNAGKSTLLNAITKSDVFVESKMFATLDPSSRRMRFPNEKEVIFVDTVGFIRDLPDELKVAFQVTLEEVGEADLLLHVVDISSPELRKQIDVVVETLNSLGFADKQRILVLNKSDLLSEQESLSLENSLNGLALSSTTRIGLVELIKIVQESLVENFTGQDPGRFTELPGRNVS